MSELFDKKPHWAGEHPLGDRYLLTLDSPGGYVIVDRDGQPVPVERIDASTVRMWIRRPTEQPPPAQRGTDEEEGHE